ncbi:MAG: ATP-dependent DNA helicase [Lachnospiraceae bacterium]|nr:ATP-dependent DNA helicase [Lachnospiraceae bacterium]
MEIRVSVRSLVEFILRSGNIDNRRVSSADAMQEGGRIHRMIQRRMGSNYHAEVGLRYCYATEKYDIVIEGRADGIIIEPIEPANGVPELTDADFPPDMAEHIMVTIDEIKGTYHDVAKMKQAVSVHLAQAKCYAYFFAVQKSLPSIRVRMTYCHLGKTDVIEFNPEEIRYFHYDYTLEELREWFEGVMEQYRKWADYSFAWQNIRQDSIKALSFPFDYREGQKELASYVYRTIYHKRKLFIEAPTGVGKTISTVFPAVKAMGEGLAEKIFYLTAKTITRTVAEDTFQLLRENGLRFKTVILTAKDKICFLEECECNPEVCPYANGHYDRINDAMYDLLTNEESFHREKIEEYARKHQVCPFEMCLDMSLFSDAVICDYNYVFDPHVYLRRFFAEGSRKDYLFLIDEAHNLVERGREMYSAVLRKEDFLKLKKVIKSYSTQLEKRLERCNKELLDLKRQCIDYRLEKSISSFMMELGRLGGAMGDYLEDHEESPVRKEVLEFYFEVSHFLSIYDLVDENYVTYSQLEEDGSFTLKLFCVNPANNLRECMMRGRSVILFSATLLPIQYYKTLLGAEEGDYEVYAQSVFQPEKRGLYIGSDVTSKYTRRSEMEYYNIAAYIYEIIKNRQGNYMIFFPSHAFLKQVYEKFEEYFANEEIECIVQDNYMNERSREEFLGRFAGNEDFDLSKVIHMDVEIEEEKTLLGFCVMGGIFSEGIDLKSDRLIGAVIVGTGLPQVCNEREILKQYFDSWGSDGFDYAYRYPGMNKVLQAAGRVIRTAEDVGIVALLDERFLNASYQRLFPREWSNYEVVSSNRIAERIADFWNRWL